MAMISKGNQRAGGRQLATHLLNEHDNERVEVAEVRGTVANDLHGAFAEWNGQARATQCTKYLYSLSVNPDQRQGHLSREQYLDFLDRVEKRLGLQHQGRAVVFHEKRDKDGIRREHCHAVWSRIDPDANRAINIAHDRMKLREVARDFARSHGLELPEGMKQDRGAERHAARAGHADLKEKQQEERTGMGKDERRAVLTDAWNKTGDGASFGKAIERAGFILARGDARAYVVVDRGGEVHSLSRQLADVKAPALKARLEPFHALDSLPTVEAARSYAIQQQKKLLEIEHQRHPNDAGSPSLEERRQAMLARQSERRTELAARSDAMKGRQNEERRALVTQQEEQRAGIAMERRTRQPRGMAGFLQRVTGIRAITAQFQQRQDRKLGELHQRQEQALVQRHRAEYREIDRHGRSLDLIDRRERRSFETRARREDFQKVAQRLKADELAVARIEERRTPADRPREPRLTTAQRRVALRQTFTERSAIDARPLPQAKWGASPEMDREALPEKFSHAVKIEATEPALTPEDEAKRAAAEREADRLREIERQRQLLERLER